MITTSAEYKTAIDAPTRRIVPKAVLDLSDPDLVVTAVSGDIDSTYSFDSQITDKDSGFSGLVYATLEQNRWLLDGSQSIMPDDPTTRSGEQGVLGDTLSDEDAELNKSITITITGVDTLQAVTVDSTGILADGYPTNMTLNIYSGALLLYSSTEDTEASHIFSGFTVIQPTDIEIIVNAWSLPSRYFRFIEILPGLIEIWDGSIIYSMNVIQRGDFSNLTIPYASASLEIDNTSKQFDPAEKNSLFLSVTARQPVPLFYGVELAGSFEYVPVGVYYQQNEGWNIENNGMTIRWDLVDIVGLLVERKYEAPSPLPTKLLTWIQSIIGQLDSTFAGHYYIDPSLGNPTLTCNASDVEDITCGDLLRFICQATNSYPVSDPVTGYLDIKPLDNTTQRLTTLRTQNSLPGSNANTDIAFLVFDVGGVQYNVPGTEEISDKTVNIKNPFISTTMDAVKAAQLILTQYGGNVLNLTCRGDMSRQIGDVETVEVYPNQTVAARIMEQTLSLENGVMINQPLRMLQANGGKLYTDVILITEDGTYTMPAGVTEITLVLVGGGNGGYGGNGGINGWYPSQMRGAGGIGGKGGRVYSTPVSINDGQQITVHIGDGGYGGAGGTAKNAPNHPGWQGSAGEDGEATTAAIGTIFSSANGIYMDVGYVDLLTNAAYGVPGYVGEPGKRNPNRGEDAVFYGNGGNGGDGGMGAIWDPEPTFDANGQIVEYARNGANGGKGAPGCVLIFYSR